MTDATIPAPHPWRANRAKTDIFSAIIRASKEFGGKTVAIVDGDGTEVDFNNPESEEIAKADFINGLLSKKNEEEVYPVLGTKFKDVKKYQKLCLLL